MAPAGRALAAAAGAFCWCTAACLAAEHDEGSGRCPTSLPSDSLLVDEVSALQTQHEVRHGVVRGAERGSEAATALAPLMLKDTGVALLELHEQALLEELLRTQSAGLNIALLLLLLLAVAITAYYMTAAPAAKKTPADRQAAPAPAPAPPRESTKSERSSEEIRPRPSLQGLSSAAPEASEAARGAGAAAAAAPQMTLGVPALSDVQLVRDAALNYDVRDSSGGKLIHISLVSPHADMVEDPSAPVEYVTLSSPDQAEELAMCAVLPSPGGGGWQCNVYQGDGSDDDFVGTLAKTRGSTGEEEFTLTSDRGARLLLIQGSVQRRQLKVTGSSGAMTASVQPSGGFFSSSYYEAACAVDADVGLTVLALLGVDRLVWRQRADAGR